MLDSSVGLVVSGVVVGWTEVSRTSVAVPIDVVSTVPLEVVVVEDDEVDSEI